MDVSRIETAPLNASGPPQSNARLKKAAEEFEAQMMKELLKPLTDNGDSDADEGGVAFSGSTDCLQNFAAEALGAALARQGGFGIASGIERQLTDAGLPAVTSVKSQDTVLRRFE
jgi:peptidoglycan hydrolase FlgJ